MGVFTATLLHQFQIAQTFKQQYIYSCSLAVVHCGIASQLSTHGKYTSRNIFLKPPSILSRPYVYVTALVWKRISSTKRRPEASEKFAKVGRRGKVVVKVNLGKIVVQPIGEEDLLATTASILNSEER